MIIAAVLPVLIAVSSPSFDVLYKCDDTADEARLCVISKTQLEALIASNNSAVAKLREIKESKACRWVETSLKAAK